MELTTETPAKINLYLRVVRRRADGYHDIETLFYPLPKLTDWLRITDRRDAGIGIDCSYPGVPCDKRNLAWKAAQHFAEASRIEPAWQITIDKRIPVAAGLGGGSSDAAAVLRSLNEAYDCPLSEDALNQVAAQLGADVPFFLQPTPCMGTGIGDILRPVPCRDDLHLVLVNPGFPVSTRWAYTHAVSEDAAEPRIDMLIGVLGNASSDLLAGRLYNTFETAVCEKFPLVTMLREFLCDAGADAAHISGSGPTVFGVFPDANTATAAGRKVREKFGAKYWVWCADEATS